ncbi:MAG: hypothetical protein ACYDAC_04135 [Candidatus Dormibacteria bacterium]
MRTEIAAGTAILSLACSGCGLAAGAGTATPSPQPSTSPLPAATPALTHPLAVFLTEDASHATTGVAAVDATGRQRWSIPLSSLNELLGDAPPDSTHPQPDVDVVAGGGHVAVFPLSPGSDPFKVVVLDSSGTKVAEGEAGGGLGNFAVSPDATEWAWSVDLDAASPNSNARHHGIVEVAGINTPAHVVYTWLAPVGSSEQIGAWTDMGIVLERLGSGGCGAGFHSDTASFLIDPQTHVLTDLLSDGSHFIDARHGVVVAEPPSGRSVVTVDGTPFDEAGTIVAGAYVSPDGVLVGVARVTPVACAGGNETAKLSTELITVSTGQTVDIAGGMIRGWFDARHFVTGDGALVNTQGVFGPTLAPGSFRGVVAAATS